ncbi:hypothetical protein [Clostridium cylindrosporum]|nr:hypothetical protein [Clostridium cylindrosporum]
MSKYISPVYNDLILWRDSEIKSGNMDKAKKLHILSRKYKYCIF